MLRSLVLGWQYILVTSDLTLCSSTNRLKGLSLALALHMRSIPCHMYELRLPSVQSSGALMLSPNALRILNSLGLYERLARKGYNFTNVAFKDENEETTDLYPLGDENLYGYKALRIYRQILLDELRSLVHESGIPITYEKKFSRIISESPTAISFEFTDGTISKASLLIGTDGIHSTVRKYISPTTSPVYSGSLAITCTVPTAALQFPSEKDYSTLPVAIHGSLGTFVLAPQDVDGSQVLAGTQKKYPEQDREGWERLFADKDQVHTLLATDAYAWPSLVQSALASVPKTTLSIWPFYFIPPLSFWSSPSHHRCIILGDAAHAIPPTAGQGASQAFEDACSLAALLADVSPETPLDETLAFWEGYRKARIEGVIKLTLKLNNTRLPKGERESLAKGMIWTSESVDDRKELDWLYNHDVEEEISCWVAARKLGNHLNATISSEKHSIKE